jgi:NO-binding membrane sensor protein with MHYT domain
MGSGVWAMHFTGMLAYTIPVTINYDLWQTLASTIPAVLAGGAGLWPTAIRGLRSTRLALSGLAMEAGVGAMHYFGIESIHTSVKMSYHLGIVALSIPVAWALLSA